VSPLDVKYACFPAGNANWSTPSATDKQSAPGVPDKDSGVVTP
jgi:hypothetical protein